MGSNFHTPYEDGVTKFKAADMNNPLSELDKAITYIRNWIVSCDGEIEWDSGTLSWDDTIRVFWNIENGNCVENTIATGSIALSDNEFAYVDLSETDGQAVAIAKAAITTDTASNFILINRFVLGYRYATSDDFYPVCLRAVWGQAGSARDFTKLKDTPNNYNGDGGKRLVVNGAEDAIEFEANTFIGLDDVPGSFSGESLKGVRVNSGETALEFYTISGSSAFTDLSDTPANYTAAAGKRVVVNATPDGLEFETNDLLGLDDFPASYAGEGGKRLVVNSTPDAVEFEANTWLNLDDTAGSFTASQDVRCNSGGNALEFYAPPYDACGTYGGTFAASTVVLRIPVSRQVIFPASMTNSQGVIGVAATAQTDFDLRKDGVSFGTMRFAAAATTATFIAASQTTFSAGNVLTVVSPASPDATAADLGFSLAGTR